MVYHRQNTSQRGTRHKILQLEKHAAGAKRLSLGNVKVAWIPYCALEILIISPSFHTSRLQCAQPRYCHRNAFFSDHYHRIMPIPSQHWVWHIPHLYRPCQQAMDFAICKIAATTWHQVSNHWYFIEFYDFRGSKRRSSNFVKSITLLISLPFVMAAKWFIIALVNFRRALIDAFPAKSWIWRHSITNITTVYSAGYIIRGIVWEKCYTFRLQLREFQDSTASLLIHYRRSHVLMQCDTLKMLFRRICYYTLIRATPNTYQTLG